MNDNFWDHKRMEGKSQKKCYFDEELRVIIHVFTLNSCICQCGTEKVHKKEETRGGWRQLPSK